MCSNSVSGVVTSLQDCNKGHASCTQDTESREPPQIGVCGKLNDCWLAVFVTDGSRFNLLEIREGESLIPAALSFDNSPVLADLARSFAENRTRKLSVAIDSLGVVASSADASDILVRLSTEAAFSLPPNSSLANKNCRGFNALQLLVTTGERRFSRFL